MFQMAQGYYFTNKANSKLLSGANQGKGGFLYPASWVPGDSQIWYLDAGNAIRTEDNLVPKQAGISENI